VDRTRTPKVVALTRKAAAIAVVGVHDDRDDEEDPAGAFDEEVPTVATSFFADLPGLVPAPTPALPWASSLDEDDLSAEFEQVTFFVEQSLPEEAEALLQDLETRFPGHPRIAAKRRELRLAEVRAAAVGSTVIEGMSSAIQVTPAPRAVVEGGGVVDPSTHADLGIAYKEMGLFDAAIAELKLLTQDPTREVFALTTMGECFEAKGSFTEAVIRYKRALNCTPIAAEEITALYFLLGGAFDRLGDISEALFFFEKVARRDPKFRDVDQKIAALKPRLVKKAR
jgi:pilus assembly protein FimV